MLDNKDKSESVLVANRCDYNTDITLDDKSSLLSTYWENGNVYPWISSYNDNYKYSSDSDEIAWGTHIRSILGWFRKDKRATFGKHKEMIDNVAVGSNENKRLVLEFLKVKKIITETSSVQKYFIEPSKLDKYGIEFNKTVGGNSFSRAS